MKINPRQRKPPGASRQDLIDVFAFVARTGGSKALGIEAAPDAAEMPRKRKPPHVPQPHRDAWALKEDEPHLAKPLGPIQKGSNCDLFTKAYVKAILRDAEKNPRQWAKVGRADESCARQFAYLMIRAYRLGCGNPKFLTPIAAKVATKLGFIAAKRPSIEMREWLELYPVTARPRSKPSKK